MIVFIKEKIVILSAPKTGTTSLQAALEPHSSILFRDPPGIKHINLGKYQRQIRKLFENLANGPLETFGIIRHPLDWMGSWYRSGNATSSKDTKIQHTVSSLMSF